MDVNEIRTLLGKYYAGQTTAEEEKALRGALRGNGVPQELNDEKQFFDRLYSCPEVPEGIEQRMSRQIAGWDMVEKTVSRKARTVSLRWVTGVAAGIAILFTVGIMVSKKPDVEQFSQRQDTYDNVQDAYVHTQDALMKMSINLNKGLDKIEKATKNKEQ